MTKIWPHPQYCLAMGPAAVRPEAVSLWTSETGTDMEKAQEFSAQKTPTPTQASSVALGRRLRGALASSETVEITSNPVKDKIPRMIAVQKTLNPPLMVAGLNGARVNPPLTIFSTMIVADRATTMVISIPMNRTDDRVETLIPR
jgi:hypothetical protein